MRGVDRAVAGWAPRPGTVPDVRPSAPRRRPTPHVPARARGRARAAAALGVAVVLAGGCASRQPSSYDHTFRTEFMSACSAEAAEAVCRCAWDRVEDEVPVYEFLRMADRLHEGPLDPVLAALASDCATRAALGIDGADG